VTCKNADVKLLQRVLYIQACVYAASGVALTLLPAPVVEGFFEQPELPDWAWVQMLGILAVGMALSMVLVGRRVEDLWWWAWTFVATGGAMTLLAALNGTAGLPDRAAAGPWWLLGAASGLLTLGLVAGLVRSGAERPSL